MKKFNLRFLILPVLCLLFAFSANAQMSAPNPSKGSAPVTSVSQIKDVKPTDKFYPALQSLVERYGCFMPYADYTFRGGDPTTREDFVIVLNNCMDRMNELIAVAEADSGDKHFYLQQIINGYSASGTNITSVERLKDIKASYEHYVELQSLVERWGIDISDADGNFRPSKSVSEKEFYEWLVKIFGLSIEGNPSATKSITRGEFVRDNAKEKQLINNLPSKGKAKIVKYLLSYSPDNTCVDFTGASDNLKFAAKDGGLWDGYKIKNDDIGDILFETKSTCKKGEKLVLVRVGTAIVTMQEKGIKRIK
jgi:S-layer homology domain